MKTPVRVLIVDDHSMVRLGLKEAIRIRSDLEVVATARTGEEGVTTFLEQLPDVTVLDFRLPDIDGTRVARRILTNHPSAKLVMLTAYEGEEDVWRAVNAGVKGYLGKTTEMNEICDALVKVSEGAEYFPPRMLAKIAARRERKDLSKREYEVLQLLSVGMSNKQIMAHLNLSLPTVRNHVSSILAKLAADDRTHAVVKAIRRGMIHLDDRQ